MESARFTWNFTNLKLSLVYFTSSIDCQRHLWQGNRGVLISEEPLRGVRISEVLWVDLEQILISKLYFPLLSRNDYFMVFVIIL